jgi:signal transduction histidine kinase
MIISLILIGGYNLNKFEALILDSFSGGISAKNEYTVFFIDEKSNEFLGHRYPYSAQTYSLAMKNLVALKPKGVSLVIDQGNYSSKDEKDFGEINKSLETFSGYKLVGELVDSAGVRNSFSKHLNNEKAIAVITTDDNHFAKDGRVRRAVLDISGNPSFTKAWAEKINGNKFYNVKGSFYVAEAEANFVYTSYISGKLNTKFIPFHMLVTGNVNLGIVEGRNVLIGPSFKSNSEYFFTKANGESISHLQLMIEQVESIIQGRTFSFYSGSFKHYLMIFLSLVIFFVLLKFKPSTSTGIFFFIIFSLVSLAFLGMRINNIYFEIMQVMAATTVTYYITLPFKAISENKKAVSLERESRMKEELDELKNNFMNLMSHDLKTPIAKISSVVDNLKTQNKSLTLINSLDLIDQSTNELNKFISEILDISKIEAKKFNLQKSQRDLNKIVKSVVSNLNYFASKKNTKINMELETLFPITLDEKLIFRVIFNLIENSIKYGGESNNILVKTIDSGKFIEVVVADSGPGIKAESLKHIFDKFYRVKNNDNEIIKGSGLGLYLVKYFVEAHGGEIEVESSVRGTIFKVKLQNT